MLKAAQDKADAAANARPASQQATGKPRNSERADASLKLSYKEKREMEQIEAELEQLEAEKSALEEDLNSGTLAYDVLAAKSARIGEIIARTDEITMRWLKLSEKKV